MRNRGFISWIVSQDGETMVIAILLIAVTILSGVIYHLNNKLTECNESKFAMQVEMVKKIEESSKEQAKDYELKLDELRSKYDAIMVEKIDEIKQLRNSVNQTIKSAKNEINK